LFSHIFVSAEAKGVTFGLKYAPEIEKAAAGLSLYKIQH
jgi:hypothetical protein